MKNKTPNQLSIPNFLAQFPSFGSSCVLCSSRLGVKNVLALLPGQTIHKFSLLCHSCQQLPELKITELIKK
ncbi:MAG: hypothetical protein GH151_02715 [Bacteroidetes bacterium]|nr:hypothetical protein [Bacteroidota bacterium]